MDLFAKLKTPRDPCFNVLKLLLFLSLDNVSRRHLGSLLVSSKPPNVVGALFER
jgi:hypothetical protein